MSHVDRAKADATAIREQMVDLQRTMAGLADRLMKIEAYIEMSAVYEADDAQNESGRARSAGVAATAVRLAVEMLKERGEPMHTRVILKALAERGLTVGGANPVANLSGFLSRSDDLQNSRAEGWSLASWPTTQDDDVPLEPEEPQVVGKVAMPSWETLSPWERNPPASSANKEPTEMPWEKPSGNDLDDDIPF